MLDVIVIGAGQAGLAAGYHLKQAGVNFVILEASDQPAGSWPSYYDSLRLFSPARYSSLPGMPFPGVGDHYPTRDEVIAYLTTYAEHFHLPVITGTRVESVTKQGDLFEVLANGGRNFTARYIIAATGSFSRPKMPTITNQSLFAGEIIHSSVYRSPDAYVGKRVIVVGGGNSAVQIAAELAQVAHVTLATRHPLRFMRQRFLGQDFHFWIKLIGIDDRKPRNLPAEPHVLDAGIYQQAVKSGKPVTRSMFTAFTQRGVRWDDGQEEAIDAVIFATGFRPNVDFLASTGALSDSGDPLHDGGISTIVTGLGYVGLNYMRSFASATLRGVGRDAQHVVKHATHYLGIRAKTQRSLCCWPTLSASG
jgi:putative flavoprotein involved in K+ transport